MDRVQRDDRRRGGVVDEVEDQVAILAAPDAVRMLDRDDVDAIADGLRDPRVVGRFIASDPVVDLEGVGQAVSRREQDGDFAIARRGRQVVGEGGDPAVPRRVGRDERDARDVVVLSDKSADPGRWDRSAPGGAGKRCGPSE